MEGFSIAERLERLPPTRVLWLRVILLSLGGFFEFYDMFLSGYIAPALVRAHVLSPAAPGLLGSGTAGFFASFFAGLTIGTALFGFIADRFGRRSIFTVSLLWYTASAVMMAFQHHAFGLDLWRLIGGIGVGVELVTIDTYIAELVPSRVRGRAFALANVVQFSAIPLVAFAAWILVPHAPLGLDGWRWILLAGAVGAIAVWFIRLRVPESPRWLAQHGRAAEAERIVSEWEAQAGAGPLPPLTHRADETKATGSILEIFRRPYRTRTLMLIVFNLFQTVGFYGFSNWVPTLLISKGIVETTSLEYTFIMAIAAPLGPLLGYLLGDRIERKWLIVFAALSVAACGLAFGAMTLAAALIIFGIGLTLSNNIMSFAFHAYQPELYPTRIRAAAVGLVYSFSRISTVFSAFVIAFVLRGFGAQGVFALIAGCMVIVALAIGIFGPRTRNLALETISR